MLLIAKLHVSKSERKGYNKVTAFSLKKHNFLKKILLSKVTRSNCMFSRNFKKA